MHGGVRAEDHAIDGPESKMMSKLPYRPCSRPTQSRASASAPSAPLWPSEGPWPEARERTPHWITSTTQHQTDSDATASQQHSNTATHQHTDTACDVWRPSAGNREGTGPSQGCSTVIAQSQHIHSHGHRIVTVAAQSQSQHSRSHKHSIVTITARSKSSLSHVYLQLELVLPVPEFAGARLDFALPGRLQLTQLA